MTYEYICRTALDLASEYESLSVDSLPLSPFTRRYVEDYRTSQDSLRSNWLRSAHIIYTALRHAQAIPSKTCLIDCGGGQGLLSLLAVKLGFLETIYSDIGTQMTSDAKAIGHAFGLPATHYIAGDLDTVARLLPCETDQNYVIVSSNVIEHVYDLNTLWSACNSLAKNRSLTAVWCSDANTANPFRVRSRRRFHLYFEHNDRAPSDWESELDTRISYFSLRRSYIKELLPDHSEDDLLRLAKATRGQNYTDIATTVGNFLVTGQIEYPAHPTNTCNPESGNWCERLIDLDNLSAELRTSGWQVHLEPGYYGPRSGFPLGQGVALINGVIKLTSPFSLVISPVYLLTLKKDRTNDISRG
jgi:hypothetical protein